MFPYYAALAAGIVLGVAGQIALKLGAEGTPTIALQFLHPATIVGFVIYVVVAHVMWNEPFGWPQLAGIVLIGGGIVLLHQ
jgi:drug/metabolite transporter (DMT)-like permease